MDKTTAPTVAVCGAGLAGTMTAVLLSRLGYDVSIYEKRDDPRQNSDDQAANSSEFGRSTSALKRSINLALSVKGQAALKEVGLLDKIMEQAIKMPGRVIHQLGRNGKTNSVVKQAYGTADQAIWSVSREGINLALLDCCTEDAGVKVFFEHPLVEVNCATGLCTFTHKQARVQKKFDLVIGADGAYSGVRENMLKQGRVDFSRDYIAHGYKELCIPPVYKRSADSGTGINKGQPEAYFALDDHEGLHIWPRGDFMLIALPNPDKSFTATLFAPYHGEDGFDSVDPQSDAAIKKYFDTHFPDVVPLLPNLVDEYRNNPVGSLVTIRVGDWNKNKCLLLGDAAHAAVPFYGQGMNAAFQDAHLLYQTLKDLQDAKAYEVDKLATHVLYAGVERFAKFRKPAGDALCDLALEHYGDMAANTASTFYLLTKKVEKALFALFPSTFIPEYTLVAFTTTPYDKAVALTKWNEKIAAGVLTGMIAAAGAGAAAAAYYVARNAKK